MSTDSPDISGAAVSALFRDALGLLADPDPDQQAINRWANVVLDHIGRHAKAKTSLVEYATAEGREPRSCSFELARNSILAATANTNRRGLSIGPLQLVLTHASEKTAATIDDLAKIGSGESAGAATARVFLVSWFLEAALQELAGFLVDARARRTSSTRLVGERTDPDTLLERVRYAAFPPYDNDLFVYSRRRVKDFRSQLGITDALLLDNLMSELTAERSVSDAIRAVATTGIATERDLRRLVSRLQRSLWM